MKNKIKMFLGTITSKLSTGIKRFPEAIFFAAATVVTLISINHGDYNSNDVLERIAMILALGIPASLCVKMLIEKTNGSIQRRVIMMIGIIGALVLYYMFLLQEINVVTSSRYIATTLALYLLFAVIPYCARKNHFELYLVNLFTRFFVTYLYAFILFLGLAFTLFTINTLFNLDLTYKLYFDMWLIVVVIFAPAFFLADIPTFEENQEYDEYSKVLKVLILYIVMPIIVVYTAILYAYFIKILFERSWPEGLVSHLVLWYSIVTSVVIVFVYPLRKSNKWVSGFTSYLPKVIMPGLLMMFISMGIRISAYGITENRYFVIVSGIWVTLAMIHFILGKKTKNIHVVIALIIIAAIAVYGPLSSYSVSKFSQNARLEDLFTKYDMIQNGSITEPSTEITQEDKQHISSIIIYFNSRHDLHNIKFIPEDYTIENIEEVLGFELFYHWDAPYNPRDYFRYFTREEGRIVDIETFDYLVEFPPHSFTNMEIDEENMHVSFNNEERVLKVLIGNEEVYVKRMDDVVMNIIKDKGDKYELKSDEMMYVDEFDNITIKYLFNHISGYKDMSGDAVNIDFIEFKVLIKTE